MRETIEDLIQGWPGVGVVTRYDTETGTWMFIALHDDSLGRASGGTRLKAYASPKAALLDAMRLAEGMTYKWAGIEMAAGGGKAVLAVGRELDAEARDGLFRRYGRLLASLNGIFSTGMDLGTTPDDMRTIASEAPWVHGIDAETGESADPGPYTALGVFVCADTAVRHLGHDGLAGRTVLVQGVGDVGAPLARRLAEAGARVLVSDVDADKSAALARHVDGETVPPDAVATTPCDVYAPCAIGATLNARTIPKLACRAVIGSANNQLEEPADAERLHERGILYAPDYVANSGGALAFALMGQDCAPEDVRTRVSGIGARLETMLADAAARDESPVHAAARRVEKVLARARARRQGRRVEERAPRVAEIEV